MATEDVMFIVSIIKEDYFDFSEKCGYDAVKGVLYPFWLPDTVYNRDHVSNIIKFIESLDTNEYSDEDIEIIINNFGKGITLSKSYKITETLGKDFYSEDINRIIIHNDMMFMFDTTNLTKFRCAQLLDRSMIVSCKFISKRLENLYNTILKTKSEIKISRSLNELYKEHRERDIKKYGGIILND